MSTQDLGAYEVGLLGLALHFEAACLSLPLLPGRLLLLDMEFLPQVGQPKKFEERVFLGAFEHIEVAYGTGDGYIERVDVEFIGVERFIAFVAGAGIVHFVLFEVAGLDTGGDIHKLPRSAGYELIQDDIGVLQAFGFLDRKDERGLEQRTGFGLVLIVHDDDRKLGGLPGFLIELLFDFWVVGETYHFSFFLGNRSDQIGAFPVNRAETGVLELEQAVGDLRDL